MDELPSEFRAKFSAALRLTPSSFSKDEWQNRAACRGLDFMTLKGHAEEARAVCRRCPVLEQCRTWALTPPRPAVPGIVAGLSPRQRGLRECDICGNVASEDEKRTFPRRNVCGLCYVREPGTTQFHVAEAAGVSQGTVAKVMRGALDTIPIETARRIVQVAEEIGYGPIPERIRALSAG